MDQGLRRRTLQSVPSQNPDSGAGSPGQPVKHSPSGVAQGQGFDQVIRGTLFAAWFIACITCISVTQFLGAPLYFIHKDYYYAYMALTKQSFGVVIITITQWFSPTVVRVSGDMSVKGQLRRSANGQLETAFPERLVMIANHQLYTDWLYLWWIAYTSRMHGHIFIILKESMKYVPVIGPGMMFYGFVFLARKFTSDKARLEHRLQKLKSRHSGPMSGAADLDPMWLVIFPEGTNLSANTRNGSKSWAEKNNIPDMRHQLLPRSTGLLFCLQQLGDTIEWVYDCTVGYEGGP
jgi:1-acyl-sn-glycerol-3-phosphate acyltransferase